MIIGEEGFTTNCGINSDFALVFTSSDPDIITVTSEVRGIMHLLVFNEIDDHQTGDVNFTHSIVSRHLHPNISSSNRRYLLLLQTSKSLSRLIVERVFGRRVVLEMDGWQCIPALESGRRRLVTR